jgi:hypothetical protein
MRQLVVGVELGVLVMGVEEAEEGNIESLRRPQQRRGVEPR